MSCFVRTGRDSNVGTPEDAMLLSLSSLPGNGRYNNKQTQSFLVKNSTMYPSSEMKVSYLVWSKGQARGHRKGTLAMILLVDC